jgi:hypothetical protein
MFKELYKDLDNFTVWTEDVYGKTFLHCEVKKWSKNTLLDMFDVMEEFNSPLFATCNDDKHRKFLSMLCFIPTGVAIRGLDGKFREVFIWGS